MYYTTPFQDLVYLLKTGNFRAAMLIIHGLVAYCTATIVDACVRLMDHFKLELPDAGSWDMEGVCE